MLKSAKFFGLAFGLVLASVSASQAATLSLVGVGDVSKPSDSSSTDSFGSKVGFGGGAILDFHLMERTSFEIGALYIDRKYDDTTLSTVTAGNAVEIPVLLRFHLNTVLSIGVGGYYSHAVGNLTATDNLGDSASLSYSDSDLSTDDYGLVGSVGLRFPITQTCHLLVDGRYNYGLKNLSTDGLGDTFKNRDIQALVGLQFALGSMR